MVSFESIYARQAKLEKFHRFCSGFSRSDSPEYSTFDPSAVMAKPHRTVTLDQQRPVDGLRTTIEAIVPEMALVLPTFGSLVHGPKMQKHLTKCCDVACKLVRIPALVRERRHNKTHWHTANLVCLVFKSDADLVQAKSIYPELA